jgi:hypothetical protein
VPYPSLHVTHRQPLNPPPPHRPTPENRRSNAMLPPCSLMLIRSVTFVWVSQMAFLPPSSPTPYPSPFSHRRPWSLPLHFPPSPFSLWSQTPRQKRGVFQTIGGGGVVSYVTGGGRRVLSPLTTHWFLFAPPFLPPPPATLSSDSS